MNKYKGVEGMECKIELYGLKLNSVRNIWRDIIERSKDTKMFLHIPGIFLGSLDYDTLDSYRLFFKNDFIYLEGSESELVDELKSKYGVEFERTCKSFNIEISDEDVERIKENRERNNLDNLKEIISKYRFRR